MEMTHELDANFYALLIRRHANPDMCSFSTPSTSASTSSYICGTSAADAVAGCVGSATLSFICLRHVRIRQDVRQPPLLRMSFVSFFTEPSTHQGHRLHAEPCEDLALWTWWYITLKYRPPGNSCLPLPHMALWP
jgi:hypothetical protein